MKSAALAKAKYRDPDKKPAKPGRPKITPDSPLTRKQELFVKELVSKDGLYAQLYETQFRGERVAENGK